MPSPCLICLLAPASAWPDQTPSSPSLSPHVQSCFSFKAHRLTSQSVPGKWSSLSFSVPIALWSVTWRLTCMAEPLRVEFQTQRDRPSRSSLWRRPELRRRSAYGTTALPSWVLPEVIDLPESTAPAWLPAVRPVPRARPGLNTITGC